ncbi:MAG: hypothetical protein V3R13_00915 [Nitrososphaerales archaeon]
MSSQINADFIDTVNDNESQISLVVFPKEDYHAQRIELARKLSRIFAKICYISMNKPYHTLVEEFHRHGIDSNKFFFMDASPRERPPETSPSAQVVGSSNNITGLSIDLGRLLKKERFDACIFESIDILRIYLDWDIVLRFIHSTVTKIRMTNSKLFLITASEEGEGLSKELIMLADNVIEI